MVEKTMQADASSMRERISFRPVIMPGDEKFLQDLYADTRDDLRGIMPDESHLRQLLVMQYKGQTSTYSAEFPNATDQIVMFDGEPVGRLLLDHRQDSIHGVDIAILSRARNLGVGTAVLIGLFEECSKKGVCFTLSVMKNNPAFRLYERLGCRIEGDTDTHYTMIWRAENI